MRIHAQPNTSVWTVTAYWLGAERAVFTGDLFECIRFALDGRGR